MNKPTEPTEDKPRWHIGGPMLEDHAAEVGRVMALLSRLEHMMNGAICQISGIGLNLGDVFFNNINMPVRRLILESVAKRYIRDKDPGLCAALIKCSERIREYKKLNQLAHGLWMGSGQSAAIEKGFRRSHERAKLSWTVQDLVDVGADVSAFIVEFRELMVRLDEVTPRAPLVHRPWQRKPQSRPRRRSSPR